MLKPSLQKFITSTTARQVLWLNRLHVIEHALEQEAANADNTLHFKGATLLFFSLQPYGRLAEETYLIKSSTHHALHAACDSTVQTMPRKSPI